ncbi:dihydroxyacetone kinase subunit DhaK [Microcoleus sp. FACHB-831]|uniref:dihydroxyacetone kinase subunit DhaK n=1 Tax=Microcoleus sp. FACHB-831 TaxID=2692827 RepID=UPI00168A3991|nr:dihydroxyacetone kinase subunit DhaK [Microcoleus sp. FACHB-831]MBD1924550.1 dihydroxyacetone kinase subunit DhaK [Microcoleus sp. FACHB-831]
MKKLINNPNDVIKESLEGMAVAHPDLIKVQFDPNVIYRIDAPVQNKVAIISGGGSGHEPMHGGFVGYGMLDAACPGEVFTSPTPDQMLEAARIVNGGAGVLNIVKNYSGDVMNFEMAAELANSENIKVANILIDDDVAVKDSLYTQGRRGVGTTVLAEKICGAAAQQGYNLQQVAELCRRVNINGRSMGMALTSCTLPAKGSPTFDLGEDEIEVGIGIHGEPGRQRMSLKSADEITEMLAISIIEDEAYTRTLREWDADKGEWVEVEITNPPLQSGDRETRVLAFVNGMGGTPLSELYIVYRKLAEICEKNGIVIVRNLIGSYITSLDMQGCSITLLNLDDEMIKLWDAPVKTPALRWGI